MTHRCVICDEPAAVSTYVRADGQVKTHQRLTCSEGCLREAKRLTAHDRFLDGSLDPQQGAKFMASLTPRQREQHWRKVRCAWKRWRAGLTDEERQRLTTVSMRNLRAVNDLPDEQRSAIARRNVRRRLRTGDLRTKASRQAQTAAARQKAPEALRAHHAGRSDEEKRQHAQRMVAAKTFDYGTGTCAWCSSSYTKRAPNQKTCGKDCLTSYQRVKHRQYKADWARAKRQRERTHA